MLHSDRVWCVAEIASAEELARKLTEVTWCCCTAFTVAGHPRYVWLNDSTSPDGAQEFAVCCFGQTKAEFRQLESITFGWSDYDKALQFILATLNGEDDNNEWSCPVTAVIQTTEEHGRCGHCA
ncbi:hypothetical protein [Rubinisphaera italica]|uniref:Uncharacterized protein n=1 Tax=Rubinisphaera italica TaxID=2527969 RepID=A0A5C5XFW8_9PLAN|nr:hypothetical protein [Rubinisphaera italica]TWT61668.1 hypothetical protein Pan54_24050 [Rubinisphaera italica]